MNSRTRSLSVRDRVQLSSSRQTQQDWCQRVRRCPSISYPLWRWLGAPQSLTSLLWQHIMN